MNMRLHRRKKKKRLERLLVTYFAARWFIRLGARGLRASR
jgi:hypothetical protein